MHLINNNNKIKVTVGQNIEKLVWGSSFTMLVPIDTLQTKLAIESGMAVEANPLLTFLTSNSNWTELLILKLVVFSIVVTIWYYSDNESTYYRELSSKILMWYTFTVSLLITLSNTIFLVLIYLRM